MTHSEIDGVSNRLMLAFLVSDSRSGSTYLAKIMHERLTGVVVTPEISLSAALLAYEREPENIENIGRALDKGRFFSALGIDRDSAMYSYVAIDKGNFTSFILRMLNEVYSSEKPKQVIVKKGHHVFDAARIIKIFPDARFICLHRDPRAVFESKRRTGRPYRPKQNMAWMGIVGSVLRGRQFVRQMISLEKSLGALRVRFEDFDQGEGALLMSLADYLSTEVTDQRVTTSKQYKIAPREETIHDAARLQSITRERAEDWKTELNDVEQSIIDFLTHSERKKLGYPDSRNYSWVLGIYGVVTNLPILLFHVALNLRQS